MKNIKTYFSPEFIRYVIIGISAYAIELGILIAFTKIGLSATKSTAISFWIGLIVAFILQKFIAFNDSSRDIKRLGSQSLVYLLLVVFNYLFTLSIVASFGDNLVLFSRSLAIFITTFWNFYIYRRLFKKTQQGKKPPSRLPSGKYMFLKFKENWLTIFIPLAFISLFFWQYISTRSRLIGGDFDYIAQLYESFRVSVIKYGQFPSWNPWMSGGIPLYTNPQFGLISIQSIFVILFGTIVGLKLGYVAYAFLGYIGFYLLLRFMKVDKFRSVLIGLIKFRVGCK